MSIQIYLKDSNRKYIPRSFFDTCLIDGAGKKEVVETFVGKRCGVYYLEQFDFYLRQKHGMTIKQYCVQYLHIEWPCCPVSSEQLGFTLRGAGLIFSQFKRGRGSTRDNPKLAEAWDRFSKERRGTGNPMFGRPAWNKGLTKDTNETLAIMGRKSSGRTTPEETKIKQQRVRELSPIKARHTTPHSKETIDKLRIETASRYGRGVFSKKTKIHIKIMDLLSRFGVSFEEEFCVGYFSLDFAIPSRKIAIEADGDYFHCHPLKYPNGPIDSIQRRNCGRDQSKNKYLQKNGWTVLRYWECEINSAEFEERLKCDCKKLSLLKE